MSPAERASHLIAGAVIGAVVLLASVAGLLKMGDDHYVTRGEYNERTLAMQQAYNKGLEAITLELRELRADLHNQRQPARR